MKLICFAHRAEAKVFLHNFELIHSGDLNLDLYKGKEISILITGEGIQSSTESVSITLAKYSNEITEIINLGIAGALNKSLDLEMIYEIRTVYSERSKEKIEFKSYSSIAQDSIIDCITTDDRVLDDEHAHRVSLFADIVDRELWAIASVAKRFNIGFRSFKLISDYAGNAVHCFDISNRSNEFSDSLYMYYLEKIGNQEIEKSEYEYQLPQAFYLTLSQKRQIKTLFEKLQLKTKLSVKDYLTSDAVKEIMDKDINPKKRTVELIHYLLKKLNPINEAVTFQLKEEIKNIEKCEGRVNFSNHYENDDIKFQITVRDKKQMESFQKAINAFNYDNVIDILNAKTKEDD